MSSRRTVELRGLELTAFRSAMQWLQHVDTVRVTIDREGMHFQIDDGDWTPGYGRVIPTAALPTIEWWTIAQAAAHCGVTPSSYSAYVSTQGAPAPTRFDAKTGRKLIDAGLVRQWHADRRGVRVDLSDPGQ
jgi:hypothetical protein